MCCRQGGCLYNPLFSYSHRIRYVMFEKRELYDENFLNSLNENENRAYLKNAFAGYLQGKLEDWLRLSGAEVQKHIVDKMVHSTNSPELRDQLEQELAIKILKGEFENEKIQRASDIDTQSDFASSYVSNAIQLQKKEAVVRENLFDTEGGMLTSKEFAKILGTGSNAVSNYYKSGKLLGYKPVEGKTTKRLYGRWQIFDGQLLPGLAKVKEVIGNDILAMRFLLLENELAGNRKPLDLLREGKTEQVVSLGNRIMGK